MSVSPGKNRIHLPRFTLAEIMGFIAALACAFKWPYLLMPVLSFGYTMVLVRSGFKFIETLIIACVTGLLIGLSLPPIRAH